jgi:uncharacterized membrane protein
MNIPTWALALSYWLHMLATVTWIGGLTALTLVILPAMQAQDDLEQQVGSLNKIQRRLDPLAWFSLLVLLGTGLMQMSASPNYEGFLAITNSWGFAILLKHLVFLGMAGVSAYLSWFMIPAQRRILIRQARGQETPEIGQLQHRNVLLIRLNLVLGIITLAFTALARVSVSV